MDLQPMNLDPYPPYLDLEQHSGSESTASLPNERDLRKTSEALVHKLLSLTSPKMDKKIIDVLLLNGIMQIFMSHISRLDDKAAPAKPLEKCSLKEQLEHARHQRDVDDMEAIKRSYHAMQRIESLNPKHKKVIHERFSEIADGLFSSFQPHSNAVLNHVCKVMMDLIQVDCYNMLELTITTDDASRFFHLMLPYLSHPGVIDVILHMLFWSALPSDSSQRDIDTKRVECHVQLQKLGFLEWLLAAIQLEDEPEYVDAVFRFLVRLIEEAAQYDAGYYLFKPLEGPQAQNYIAAFVKVIETDERIRPAAISVLSALVKSGSVGTTRSIQNGGGISTAHGPLYTASKKSQEILLNYIPNLCNVLVQNKVIKPAERKKSFTLCDLDILEIVYESIRSSDFGVKALVNMTAAFWKLLVNAFFDLSQHNIFHTIFYKFFCLVLETHHGPTLKAFIRKQQLITRIIDLYEDKSKDTSSRGYILLMLNHLRLSADAEPTSEIAQMVGKHPRFNEFLPTLRSETLRQIQPTTGWPMAPSPRPAPHIGPSPPLRSSNLSPYGVTLTLSNNSDDHHHIDEFGIDLGSRYAYCLGFDHDATKVPESRPMTPNDFSSRRTSLHSESGESTHSETETSAADNAGIDLSDPLFWGGSLTPEPSPSKKKKTKRKKDATGSKDAVEAK